MKYAYQPQNALSTLLRDYLIYSYYFDLQYTEQQISTLVGLTVVRVSHIISAFKRMSVDELKDYVKVAQLNYDLYCTQLN